MRLESGSKAEGAKNLLHFCRMMATLVCAGTGIELLISAVGIRIL